MSTCISFSCSCHFPQTDAVSNTPEIFLTDIPEVPNILDEENIPEPSGISAGKEVLESVYVKDTEEEMADIVNHKPFIETVVIIPDTTEQGIIMEDDLTENNPDVDVSETVIEDVFFEREEPPSETVAKELTTESTSVVLEKPTIVASEEPIPVEKRGQEITEAPSRDIQDTAVTEEESSEITETGPKFSDLAVSKNPESDMPAELPSEYPAVEFIPDETKPSPSELDNSEMVVPVTQVSVFVTEVTIQDSVLTTTEQTAKDMKKDSVADDKPTVVNKVTSKPSILILEDEETPNISDDEIEGKEGTPLDREEGVHEGETTKSGAQEEAASVEDDMGTVVENDEVIEHLAKTVEILEPSGSDAKESSEETIQAFGTPAYKLEPEEKVEEEEENTEAPAKEAHRIHVEELFELRGERGEEPESVKDSPKKTENKVPTGASQQGSEVEDEKVPVIPSAPLESSELNLEEVDEDDVAETEEEGSPPGTSMNSETSKETTIESDEAVTPITEEVQGLLPGSSVDTSETEEEVQVNPDEDVQLEATDTTSEVKPTSDALESFHDTEKQTIPEAPSIAPPDVVPHLEETNQLDEISPDSPHDPVLNTSPASPIELFPKEVEVISPEDTTEYVEEPATVESAEAVSDGPIEDSTHVTTVGVTPKYVVEYNNGNFPDLAVGPFDGDDGLFGNNGFDLDNEEEHSVRRFHQEMLFQAVSSNTTILSTDWKRDR